MLLPVGTDYTPPNKWVTAIHRDWNQRYVWPKFIAAIPRDFFAAVRAEQAASGRPFSPQTRDMNPIYTGKDVTFIDTKQAQRIAENTLLGGEKFATIAGLLGAPASRRRLSTRHGGNCCSEPTTMGSPAPNSDQVYLDLLAGWREAVELGTAVQDGALDFLGAAIDTTGDGQAVTVFNAMSWPRTDIARVEVELPAGSPGIDLVDDAGARMPFLLESVERSDEGRATTATIAFVARDVPALGYRTYRAVPGMASHRRGRLADRGPMGHRERGLRRVRRP